MGNAGNYHEVPPGVSPDTLRPRQKWTPDGYPIVDGKSHDLATDEIKTYTGPFHGGPPSTSVYWDNRSGSRPGQFYAMGSTSQYKVTEYRVRVGEMLKVGKCTVHLLNATEYAVNVIVATELSSADFIALLQEHGLTASR